MMKPSGAEVLSERVGVRTVTSAVCLDWAGPEHFQVAVPVHWRNRLYSWGRRTRPAIRREPARSLRSSMSDPMSHHEPSDERRPAIVRHFARSVSKFCHVPRRRMKRDMAIVKERRGWQSQSREPELCSEQAGQMALL